MWCFLEKAAWGCAIAYSTVKFILNEETLGTIPLIIHRSICTEISTYILLIVLNCANKWASDAHGYLWVDLWHAFQKCWVATVSTKERRVATTQPLSKDHDAARVKSLKVTAVNYLQLSLSNQSMHNNTNLLIKADTIWSSDMQQDKQRLLKASKWSFTPMQKDST